MYGGSEKLRRCFCLNRVWRQKVLLLILLRDDVSLVDTWEELRRNWKKMHKSIVPNNCSYFCWCKSGVDPLKSLELVWLCPSVADSKLRVFKLIILNLSVVKIFHFGYSGHCLFEQIEQKEIIWRYLYTAAQVRIEGRLGQCENQG